MKLRGAFILILLTLAVSGIPQASRAQVAVGISVRVGPPALPVYAQPLCPGPGYIWVPGYWAYGPYGYYWVPGTWVMAPEPGFLWTPGYWGWSAGLYYWHAGYWGPHVGFYGGIDYGYGYPGYGYRGGYWNHGAFFYNRSVNNVNITNIHNVYNTTVVERNVTVNRVSYNGGPGGLRARPTAEDESFARERHMEATSGQVRQEQVARANPTMRADLNHGRPAIAATARPGAFTQRAPANRAPGQFRSFSRSAPQQGSSRPAQNNGGYRAMNGPKNAPQQGYSRPAQNNGGYRAVNGPGNAPREGASRPAQNNGGYRAMNGPRNAPRQQPHYNGNQRGRNAPPKRAPQKQNEKRDEGRPH